MLRGFGGIRRFGLMGMLELINGRDETNTAWCFFYIEKAFLYIMI